MRAQVDSVAMIFGATGDNPDFNMVLESEDWTKMMPDDRRSVIEYARGQGFTNLPEDAPEVKGAGDETALPVEAKASSETTKTDETETAPSRESGRQKRQFVGYEASVDDSGRVFFVERVIERSESEEGQERVRKTRFDFSPEIMERLAGDEALRNQAAARLSDLRRELERRRGVKLFIDRPKDGGARVIPKWKYRIGGRMQEDVLTESDLPAEILDAIRQDNDYWKTPDYKRWFGKAMQQKREDVLAEILSNELGNNESAGAGSEAAVTPDDEGMVFGYGGDFVESETKESATAEKAKVNVDDKKKQIDKSGHTASRSLRHYFGPEDREAGMEDLREGARGVLADFAELIHDRESAERYRGIVEDFVWTGLEAQARVAGADEPGLSRVDVKQAADDVINDYLRALGEKPIEDEQVDQPGKGDTDRKESLQTTGTKRSAKKVGGRDSRSVALKLDRRHPESAVELAIGAAVDEALGSDVAEDVRVRTRQEIVRYVSGTSPVSERFRAQIAGIDGKTLVIRDYDLLKAAIRKFAERL